MFLCEDDALLGVRLYLWRGKGRDMGRVWMEGKCSFVRLS